MSYPNFFRGPLFARMRTTFDHFQTLETNPRGIRKVLGDFRKKLAEKHIRGVDLVKLGV